MLISTSRKPVQISRRLAKCLAAIIPDSAYSTRGKSSIHQLAHKAGLGGHSRLLIIEDSRGNPSCLRFAKVIAGKSGHDFEWLEQAVAVKSVKLDTEPKRQPKPEGISFEGSCSRQMSEMLGLDAADFDSSSSKLEVCCTDGLLSFCFQGRRILEISLGFFQAVEKQK
ncbi:hypothetical protein FJZ26_05175 [Candidatus Parvarchaeota archaeon]|nr:hypothetical protein [Candidatus Parvarchaeota archaeon]